MLLPRPFPALLAVVCAGAPLSAMPATPPPTPATPSTATLPPPSTAASGAAATACATPSPPSAVVATAAAWNAHFSGATFYVEMTRPFPFNPSAPSAMMACAAPLTGFEWGGANTLAVMEGAATMVAALTAPKGQLPARLIRPVDRWSPLFAWSWSVNAAIKTLTIVVGAGTTVPGGTLRQYVFSTAQIVGDRHYVEADPAGGTREMEEITIWFQKLTAHDAAGKETPIEEVSQNLSALPPCAPDPLTGAGCGGAGPRS